MRDNLIRDLLNYLDRDGNLSTGHCPPDAEAFLEELDIPLDVKRLFQWRWINKPCKLGPYNFYSVKEIISNEDFGNFLKDNIVPIGWAINGDPLVLNFPDEEICEVGLISHDQYYEEECGPTEAYTRVKKTVEELLHSIVEDRFLPIDYYSAIELNEIISSQNENV